MGSREFLNVAHAALVEEFMRPRTVRGVAISGMALEEALERATPWAEGYDPGAVDVPEQGGSATTSRSPVPKKQKSEEEMVAQNEAAMQHLMARMSNVKGGFTRPSA
jgi:hypothetical protein